MDNAGNKMFDLAEKCCMEYMLQYVNLPADVLFENILVLKNKTMPLVIKPIPEHSDNLICLYLKIVPWDYVSEIPESLKENEVIISMIGFIYHSITTVYNSILNSNIKEKSIDVMCEASMHLEMDDDTISMYPIFIYPQRRKELMFLQVQDDVEKTLQDIQEQYDNLVTHIKNIVYDKQEADKIEQDANLALKKNNRIGIVYKEVPVDKLSEYYESLDVI
jgi:hypothetical protein